MHRLLVLFFFSPGKSKKLLWLRQMTRETCDSTDTHFSRSLFIQTLSCFCFICTRLTAAEVKKEEKKQDKKYKNTLLGHSAFSRECIIELSFYAVCEKSHSHYIHLKVGAVILFKQTRKLHDVTCMLAYFFSFCTFSSFIFLVNRELSLRLSTSVPSSSLILMHGVYIANERHLWSSPWFTRCMLFARRRPLVRQMKEKNMRQTGKLFTRTVRCWVNYWNVFRSLKLFTWFGFLFFFLLRIYSWEGARQWHFSISIERAQAPEMKDETRKKKKNISSVSRWITVKGKSTIHRRGDRINYWYKAWQMKHLAWLNVSKRHILKVTWANRFATCTRGCPSIRKKKTTSTWQEKQIIRYQTKKI